MNRRPDNPLLRVLRTLFTRLDATEAAYRQLERAHNDLAAAVQRLEEQVEELEDSTGRLEDQVRRNAPTIYRSR